MKPGRLYLPGEDLVAPAGTQTGHGGAHSDDCDTKGPGIHCERCEWGIHMPPDLPYSEAEADGMLDVVGFCHTFTCHPDVATTWDPGFRWQVGRSVDEMKLMFPPQYFQLRHLNDGTCIHPNGAC